jgi:tetratricopeptide (TPR) repeat protein
MYYSEDNLNLAKTYSNIGTVYTNQGKLQYALDQYKIALAIEKKHYDETHYELAGT